MWRWRSRSGLSQLGITRKPCSLRRPSALREPTGRWLCMRAARPMKPCGRCGAPADCCFQSMPALCLPLSGLEACPLLPPSHKAQGTPGSWAQVGYSGTSINGCLSKRHAVCRSLLRRYPDFDDPRAALAAAEWELGQYERAEGDWNRVQDPRYADKEWLLKTRRWPVTLCEALQAFLEIRMTRRGNGAA